MSALQKITPCLRFDGQADRIVDELRNEAISLSVDCATQGEVDELWEKLSEGGSKGRCGWLKDKFGLSWQIAPTRLTELMSSSDEGKSQRVMAAMMKMTKLDIAEQEAAAAKS